MNGLIQNKKINFGQMDLQVKTFENKLEKIVEGVYRALLQIVVIFDITGSTLQHFKVFKSNSQQLFKTLKKYVPESEYAISGIRNHGDEDHYPEIIYERKFTKDESEIEKFLEKIKHGGGGENALCCLEDALNHVNNLSWQADSFKSLILFVDEPANSGKQCPYGYDWNKEIEGLIVKNIKVHVVFVGYKDKSRKFYQEIATRTGGRIYEIGQIDNIIQMIIGMALGSNTNTLYKYLMDLKKYKLISSKDEVNLTLLLK